MHYGIQLLHTVAIECQLGQPGAIQPAIGIDHPRAKDADDLGIDTLARLHERAAQLVGFDHLGAQRAQQAGYRAFAAAQAAGEPYAQHGFRAPAASWPHGRCWPSAWRWSADRRL